MHNTPKITVHRPSMINHWRGPVFFDNDSEPVTVAGNAGWSAIARDASREESRRQMAMNRPVRRTIKPEMPELSQPSLSEDHNERAAALEKAIYERGLAVDPAKLLSLGRERFDQLRVLELEARAERVLGSSQIDLTDFASVYLGFAHANAVASIPVPRQSTFEQYIGNDELELAIRVESFDDLWKFSSSEGRAVRAVNAYRQLFGQLIMGQSLFEWEDDSYIHHNFFGRGSGGKKTSLFEAWLPALGDSSHYRVSFKNSLASLVFWLSGEQTPAPTVTELATEWTGARVPSADQLLLAQSVWDAFLLNLSGWDSWAYVGRATGKIPDRVTLDFWHENLRRRTFPSVPQWHRDIAAFFYHTANKHEEFKFEAALCRKFVDQTLEEMRNCVSEVAALCIEENSPSDVAPVMARFQDWILCKGKPKTDIVELVTKKLSTAFPGINLDLELQ